MFLLFRLSLSTRPVILSITSSLGSAPVPAFTTDSTRALFFRFLGFASLRARAKDFAIFPS